MSEKKRKQERMAFHGSDIEQIEQVYGIPKESIVKFGANVNPLGLSDSLKKTLSEHLDVITCYPDRDYKTLRAVINYGLCGYRKRLHRTDLASYQPEECPACPGHRSYLFRI